MQLVIDKKGKAIMLSPFLKPYLFCIRKLLIFVVNYVYSNEDNPFGGFLLLFCNVPFLFLLNEAIQETARFLKTKKQML